MEFSPSFSDNEFAGCVHQQLKHTTWKWASVGDLDTMSTIWLDQQGTNLTVSDHESDSLHLRSRINQPMPHGEHTDYDPVVGLPDPFRHQDRRFVQTVSSILSLVQAHGLESSWFRMKADQFRFCCCIQATPKRSTQSNDWPSIWNFSLGEWRSLKATEFQMWLYCTVLHTQVVSSKKTCYASPQRRHDTDSTKRGVSNTKQPNQRTFKAFKRYFS